MKDPQEQINNPLHGITLERILIYLVDNFGWEYMNKNIELQCFFSHPSIKSSLIFLRKNQWARDKVEALYIHLISKEISK
jgi:uncharacterized protein (DUF2132 family)